MCGIVGIINKKETAIDLNLLNAMNDSLFHRGPDAGNTFIQNNIGLGHRRLKIIDLSESANQPLFSTDKRYCLVFNGEIFNFHEFYDDLKSKGYNFKSKSDSEVLLYLLIEYGAECLHKLNGFWAFAFFDTQTEEILLCRDRLGVKPLFIYETSEILAFASEPKAFFSAGLNKEIEDNHLDELFFYRNVSGENTIFKNIRRLLPGHSKKYNAKGDLIVQQRWFHLGEEAKKIGPIDNPVEWFEETFYNSIKYRMIADVPIGTLLSGGLDSSSVLYAQSKLGYENLSSWNISFSNFKDDESDIARKFSKQLNSTFFTKEFTGDELVKLTIEAIHHMDEPFMHMQEPHLLGLCKAAKEKVTILQSGEASDELLGGYVRYKIHDNQLRYNILQLIRIVPSKYLKSSRWMKMKKYLSIPNQPFQLLTNANNIFLDDLKSINTTTLNLLPEYRVQILKEAEEYYPNNRLRQLMYMDHFIYVPSLNDRNDRVSMGASIENREPFEDKNLLTGVFSLGDQWFDTKGKGKKLLMESIGKKLPDYIVNHRKIGLSIPWFDLMTNNQYFRAHLLNMHSSEIFQHGFFWMVNVQSLSNDYVKGNREHSNLVFQLFFLSLWYEVSFNNFDPFQNK
jgi:asparagine synthase (glutamine-hydrolysing)